MHILSKRRNMWGAPTRRFPSSLADGTAVICVAVAAEHSKRTSRDYRMHGGELPCKSTGDFNRLQQARLACWIILDDATRDLQKRIFARCPTVVPPPPSCGVDPSNTVCAVLWSCSTAPPGLYFCAIWRASYDLSRRSLLRGAAFA